MKRRIFSAVFALAISCGVVGAFAQEQAPAPTFKEGDSWQINISRKDQGASSSSQTEGAYELVFTQGKIKVFEINGDQKSEVNVQPESPAEGLLGVVGKNEKRPDLKFPLSVGQKWEYQVVVRPAGARQDQRRSAEVTVVGQEQVTTPAGSFKAFKLVRSESWSVGRGGGSNTSTSTFYYSSETRSIVKRVTENANNPAVTVNELIKFTPGN
jgi:hypothetical protein